MPVRNPYFAAMQGPAQSSTFNALAKGWLGRVSNKVGGDQALGAVGVGSYDINMDETCTVTVHTNRTVVAFAKAIVTIGGTGAAKISLDIVEGGTTLGRAGERTVSAGDVVSFSGFEEEDIAVFGTHTFKLQLTVILITSGAPTFTIAGSYPGQARLRVIDDGASS